MQTFDGFHGQSGDNSLIPAEFFNKLLPLIDDLDEMKITLFAMWALQQKDGTMRFLRLADFVGTVRYMHGLSDDALQRALARAVKRGTLLTVIITINETEETLYVANSPAGQALITAIEAGQWQVTGGDLVEILPERPNIYKLYEENIGALTPMISEELKDLQSEYGDAWLREAIAISVQSEKRNLRYIGAILKRWKQEGKHEASRGHSEGDDGQWKPGQYSDIIKR